MSKKINNRINQYLKTNWLRPETLLWDVHLSLLIEPYLKRKIKKLEIGIGNGINSFITLGGELNKNYDTYQNLNYNSFVTTEDIYNTYKKNSKKIIKKKVKNKFDLVIDHKENLLKQARLLDISNTYLKHDCNKSIKIKDKFDLIYTNILYWLKNPFYNIREFNDILNKKGLLIFTLPNENFFKYCKSYKSKNKFWKKLNLQRNKHFNFSYKKKEIGSKLKKMKFFKIIKVKSFLSKKSCKIWDIGTRIVSPELIKMSSSLSKNEKLIIKYNWCKKLHPLIYELIKDEIKDSKSGGFDLYILKKV